MALTVSSTAPKATKDGEVAVIGYPAFDSRNGRQEQIDIFKNIFNVKRLQPGKSTGIKQSPEILGHDDVEVHKYAIQITVADVRDGACSSSTLQEAASWGKVSTALEQMVYAEATSVLPLLASDAYHRGHWKTRAKRAFSKMFD